MGVKTPGKRHRHLVRSGYRARGNPFIGFNGIWIRCWKTWRGTYKELLAYLVLVLLDQKLVACHLLVLKKKISLRFAFTFCLLVSKCLQTFNQHFEYGIRGSWNWIFFITVSTGVPVLLYYFKNMLLISSLNLKQMKMSSDFNFLVYCRRSQVLPSLL